MTTSNENLMPNTGLTEKDLAQLRSVLEKFPKIEQALIFGSRAKGTYKPGSDVDLVIKGSELTLEAAARVSYLLNEETMMPYAFDVVQFESISSPSLTEHINRVGISIYPDL